MSFVYEKLLRPVLFQQEAETAHERTLHILSRTSENSAALKTLSKIFRPSELPNKLFGLTFPNPIGLAAGMDKFAAALPAWPALGFGFTELGGVTWHAQPGNPKPRIFRAIKDEAIVNRMGFNNDGAEAMARKLADWRARGLWPNNHPVAINLGKSKVTPLEKAAEDYANSLRVLLPHADFFIVNVSSPNTPNLRQLQDKSALREILIAMRQVRVGNKDHSNKPILVKVAPDLSLEALDEIVELAMEQNLDGIVATNTTITRPSAGDASLRKVYAETGGLSGRPLRSRSTGIIHHLYKHSRGRIPIIGVGGIFTAEDAWEKIAAGASLLQIYTSLVYCGPSIAKTLVNGLRARLNAQGVKSLSLAVGTAAS